ncbi:kinase-like domain-containing protein [Mycena crocata]|nr:kinase-like domain-containing protein [Mycena crocata]
MSIDAAAEPEGVKTFYFGDEEWWVKNQPFILSQGFKLRPRYDPNWIPSWSIKEHPKEEYEDGLKSYISTPALDATRVSNGEKVVLKRVSTGGGDSELRIATLLSSESLRSDRRNHTVPIPEVIEMPHEDWSLLVMPYCRRFDDPPFHCPAEFIEAMQQFLEGLQFMHDQNICHFDIAPKNLMMDETRVVPQGSHFIRPRTHTGFRRLFRSNNRCAVGPIHYYYIDFDLSLHFPDGQATATALGALRTFDAIPELSETEPYNPFKVDIYQLGLVMEKLIETYAPLKRFAPVAAAMMTPNPQDRPSPSESLVQLNRIAAQMAPRALSAPMWKKNHLFDHVTRRLVGGYFPKRHIFSEQRRRLELWNTCKFIHHAATDD